MTRCSIDGASLLDPEGENSGPGRVLIDGDRIEAILPSREERVVSGAARAPGPEVSSHDATGLFVAPGFVDLHFHGELIFAQPEGFASALERASAELARHGTTSFLATTVAWGADRLLAYVTRLVEAMTHSRQTGAQALGLHLEGPWISPDAAGAQPLDAIRPYQERDREILFACSEVLKMVTLAPELDGADALIDALQQASVIPALGHSRITHDAAERAFERGMTHVTHLFNAMGPMHHREPGLAGAVLGAREPVSCDLICDGVHVAPEMVRLASRCLGERLSLITDRIELPPLAAADARGAAGTAGTPDGSTLERGQPDFGAGDLVDDGVAWRLRSDGRLAGSRLTLDRAIRNAREFGAMRELEAIAAVTLRPARLLGLEREIGTLRPGSRADLVLLDGAGEVVETWVAGRCVYAGPGRRASAFGD